MSDFKNTVLLVVFNYSNCIFNNIIKNIYLKHFKKIFYADYPVIQDEEVN